MTEEQWLQIYVSQMIPLWKFFAPMLAALDVSCMYILYTDIKL